MSDGSTTSMLARDDLLRTWVGRNVVLDTSGPLVYIGRLLEVNSEGFLLEEADVHDRTEGHASKEQYVCEAREHGVRANRQSVFVFRAVVLSLSPLDDVIAR